MSEAAIPSPPIGAGRIYPDLDHIPGDYGMFLFGNTFRYLLDPFGYPFRRHALFGAIQRDNVFFTKGVDVSGPDFVERFLVDKESLFSSKGGWWSMLGPFFEGGLMLRDFANHRVHRGIMRAAFQTSAMRGYATAIDALVERSVAALRPGRGTPMFPRIKRLLLDTATTTFLGIEGGAESEQVNDDFVRMMEATVAVVRLRIPFSPYDRGLRARDRLRARFLRLTRERLATPPQKAGDMLSILCAAVGEDGERFTADEICDHLLFLLMAAHDTTTSALTNLLMMLALHPEWQDRVRAESTALGRDAFTFADLDALPTAYDCMRETLRLYPPVRVVPRLLVRDAIIQGYHVPAGTPLWLTIEHHHRDPDLWTDPHRFDPDRFSDARAEHKRHRFAWIPFGAGAHTCMGLHFGDLEIRAYLHRLLRRYRIALPAGYVPRLRYLPFVKPQDDLPLILTPLS